MLLLLLSKMIISEVIRAKSRPFLTSSGSILNDYGTWKYLAKRETLLHLEFSWNILLERVFGMGQDFIETKPTSYPENIAFGVCRNPLTSILQGDYSSLTTDLSDWYKTWKKRYTLESILLIWSYRNMEVVRCNPRCEAFISRCKNRRRAFVVTSHLWFNSEMGGLFLPTCIVRSDKHFTMDRHTKKEWKNFFSWQLLLFNCV